MNRSKKLRSVYAELKQTLGNSLSPEELLECALLMVDASEDSIYEPNMNNRPGRTPFSELPVNHVIENYGWLVVNREQLWEDDFAPQLTDEMRIEACIAKAA